MRSFVVAFLFLVLETTFGLDRVFPKLKDLNKETLVIFNCENIVFSYLDAVFSEQNKDIWDDFNKRRERLNHERNMKIDRALLFAPRRIVGMNYKKNFKDIQDKGANIVFVYQVNEDRMKFSKELSRDIRFSTFSVLRELNLKKDENVEKVFSSEKTERTIDFENGLLITTPKNISGDLSRIAVEFLKNKPIRKIIIIHDGSVKLDKSEIKIYTEEIKIKPQESRSIITKEQINRQMEILLESGDWMDDNRMQMISNLSDEKVIYEICKQSIIDVCPCKEIIEEEIYGKISSVLKNKNSTENLEEIIDYFQEINNSLPSIFHYVNRVYLWKSCLELNIKEAESIKMLKKMKRLYFNEHEVREVPYKILRRIGCGIHWRDMEKYNYVKNFIMKGEKVRKISDSSRSEAYSKVLEVVFDRMNRDMKPVLDEFRDELIKILIQNNIEKENIKNVFKISEEKLKNIISVNSLKNEESQPVIDKNI